MYTEIQLPLSDSKESDRVTVSMYPARLADALIDLFL